MANGTAPNKFHIIDFGADYAVSATSFGFQSNIFADRLAGSAVYGSNDGKTWVCLTSELTKFTQDFQILEVNNEYKNCKFRFFKIQMLENYPDILHNIRQGLFEISEFRIYGQQYETGNVINMVSIKSDSTDGRTVEGNTVTLVFTATESISDVSVTFENGNTVPVIFDGTKYSATWKIENNDSYDVGENADFKIDYIKSSDNSHHIVFETTDNTAVFLSSNQYLIDCTKAKYIDSTSGRAATVTATNVGYLFDSLPSTCSDFRYNGGGSGAYIIFDFYGNNKVVNLLAIEMLARQDIYYTRINGTYVQGSNDGVNWVDLSKSNAVSSNKWQKINILSNEQNNAYRYIKIVNNSAWFGNIAELRLIGSVTELGTINSIYNVSISSNNSNHLEALPGDKVKLSFSSYEEISNVLVTINGKNSNAISADNKSWTAEYTVLDTDYTQIISFTINYSSVDGNKIGSISSTTDNTSVTVIEEANLIDYNFADFSLSSNGGVSAQKLYDGKWDSSSSTDFRVGSSGFGGYVVVDFTNEYKVNLTKLKIIARSDQVSRLAGAKVYVSNDAITWTQIGNALQGITDWQIITVPSNYSRCRYLKIYNSANWYGNIGELKLYGETVKVVKSTLISIVQPSNITGVANGTDKTTEALKLPSKVTLKTDNGDIEADVKWNIIDCVYNPLAVDEQTFSVSGIVILPDDVMNTNNISESD